MDSETTGWLAFAVIAAIAFRYYSNRTLARCPGMFFKFLAWGVGLALAWILVLRIIG